MSRYSVPVQNLLDLLDGALKRATPIPGKGYLLESRDVLKLTERLVDLTAVRSGQ